MRSWSTRVELVSAVQEEENFIKVVVLEEEVFEDFALPCVAEVFIEKIHQKCYLFLVLYWPSAVFYSACFGMNLVFLKEAYNKFREAGIFLVGAGQLEVAEESIKDAPNFKEEVVLNGSYVDDVLLHK